MSSPQNAGARQEGQGRSSGSDGPDCDRGARPWPHDAAAGALPKLGMMHPTHRAMLEEALRLKRSGMAFLLCFRSERQTAADLIGLGLLRLLAGDDTRAELTDDGLAVLSAGS